jgi:hypothetical protein
MTSKGEQRERREVIENDRRLRQPEGKPDTYFSRALADAGLELGGRFGALAKPVVTGTAPYPMLPASSPWSVDPVPTEPPLGFSVDAREPVGTAAEIERSWVELAPADAVSVQPIAERRRA